MASYFEPGTAHDAKLVTPSDTVDLPGGVCQALYVGTAGNLSVITASGTTVLITGATAGSVIPLQVSRVKSTSTTASTILAFY